MHRRQFLATSTVAGLGATAGCNGIPGSWGSDDESNGESDGVSIGGEGRTSTIPDDVSGRYSGFQGGPRHRSVADGPPVAPAILDAAVLFANDQFYRRYEVIHALAGSA